MKRFAIIMLLFSIFSVKSDAGYRNVDFEIFYESLAPFGEWIKVDYDLVVWKPFSQKRDWAPYKKGQWIWTSDGWFWDSYEPFGWATYHYGRWHYDEFYGWLWFPGEKWAPAWVEWRYSDNYIGWAPLSPYAEFRLGFGIKFTTKRRHHSHWNFVSINKFHGCDVSVHIINRSRVPYIVEETRYRTNYYNRNSRIINGGINITFVEKRSGRRINTRRIVTTRNNFDRNEVVYRDKRRIDVYRPDFTRHRTRRSDSDFIKSDRSFDLDRSKIVTKRRQTTSSSNNLRHKYNPRRSEKRKITTSRSSDGNIRHRSDRRKMYTNVYNRDLSESKRHSKKSSGRSITTRVNNREISQRRLSKRERNESYRTRRR